ncbi:MAG: hypothetical protein ABIV48_09850, partial [Pyrinomonadaceae bacterium]
QTKILLQMSHKRKPLGQLSNGIERDRLMTPNVMGESSICCGYYICQRQIVMDDSALPISVGGRL